MAMTIVEAARGVTGGVDTHLDVHVAAALDPLGTLLGSESFAPTLCVNLDLDSSWLRCVSNEGVQGARTLESRSAAKSTEPPVEPELPQWEPGQKRRFPEDFKRRAVAYYESLPEDGSRGAYLRRAGIYSSAMSLWRQGVHGGVVATAGRKPSDPLLRKNAELAARVTQLEDELARANLVIEVQKKGASGISVGSPGHVAVG
jgi:transposase